MGSSDELRASPLFLLGMIANLASTHEAKSNREAGLGRYDVAMAQTASADLHPGTPIHAYGMVFGGKQVFVEKA